MRHIAERSVAPFLRSDLHRLGIDHGLTVQRLGELELKVDLFQELHDSVRALETHQPTILNAIASTNGTSRLLARETAGLRSSIEQAEETVGGLTESIGGLSETIGEVRESLGEVQETTSRRLNEIEPAIWAGDEAVRDEMRPHIDTLAWLLQRVETVRAEMMHELRYGQSREAALTEPKIINPAHLGDADVRLNLGAGHIAIDGFVNVDMRELPGIDVVAPIDALPFEPGTIAEIFSSHTVEHFPEEQLRRRLLPYWVGLLRPGGVFRAIVPDLEAMTKSYAKGELSFETLRAVTYGGQEYEGDFHFTGFTPDSMSSLLIECGLERPTVIAEGRSNGDCLEFEVSAVKPSS